MTDKDYDEFTKRMTSFDLTLSPDGGDGDVSLEQSSTTGLDDVLEHYGVKGMKWGVRRTPEQLGRARAARKARKAEAKAQKKADQSRPPSADAVEAATYRRVAKNAGTASLSNKELDILLKRMNLEQRYVTALGSDSKSLGRVFVESIMDQELKAFNKNQDSPTAITIKQVQQAMERALDFDPILDKALKS